MKIDNENNIGMKHTVMVNLFQSIQDYTDRRFGARLFQ
jgi:hypothetical protein